MFIIRICVIPEMESAGEVKRAGILFFRTMLQELQECLCLLDSMDFVSLLLYEHKYHVDSILQDITLQEVEANVALVHDVLKGVILFSQREKDSLSDLEEWEKWKFVSLGVISSGQILTVELAGVRMQESASSEPTPELSSVHAHQHLKSPSFILSHDPFRPQTICPKAVRDPDI